MAAAPASAAAAAGAGAEAELLRLNREAREAYAGRDFGTALTKLDQLLEAQPKNAVFLEMRAQVGRRPGRQRPLARQQCCRASGGASLNPLFAPLSPQARVDAKKFDAALEDFDAALRLTPASAPLDRARLLAGRGLALEGVSDWVAAISDYSAAIEAAAGAGELPDPYILNSRGNCHASLGEWRAARGDYLASAEGFRAGFGFSRGARLDGAVYSAGNAALMLAQLGDEAGALAEVQVRAQVQVLNL